MFSLVFVLYYRILIATVSNVTANMLLLLMVLISISIVYMRYVVMELHSYKMYVVCILYMLNNDITI